MLGRGGLAVAVANAADSVLAAADLVVPTNEEHGVATLLDVVVEQRRAARAGERERPPPGCDGVRRVRPTDAVARIRRNFH
ncbi:HAD hydrolase family protein [Saccharopolyspora shandongensis]|uniref:HAD family hydrolase n=1 Tax=Saccharopolyspora shandongensis TaxID=418495 RepID=UPI0033DD37E5